jgi:hypothetical protein
MLAEIRTTVSEIFRFSELQNNYAGSGMYVSRSFGSSLEVCACVNCPFQCVYIRLVVISRRQKDVEVGTNSCHGCGSI